MLITRQMISEGDTFTKDLTKANQERFIIASKSLAFRKYVQRSGGKGGAFIAFEYDALHKDTLKFWDRFPAVIVLGVKGSRMLGINLHFTPFPMRKLIVEYVVRKNSSNIKYNKPIEIDYREMKPFLKSIKALICIRSYIIGRMKDRITVVNSHKDYIIGATTLKTDKIYGMTSDQIYKLSLGKSYSTKKKIGQRSTDRAQKKKALKTKA